MRISLLRTCEFELFLVNSIHILAVLCAVAESGCCNVILSEVWKQSRSWYRLLCELRWCTVPYSCWIASDFVGSSASPGADSDSLHDCVLHYRLQDCQGAWDRSGVNG